jgi:ATP-dependent Zn protease
VNKNNKKWRNAGLYALLLIVVLALASAFLDRQPQSREVLTYSDFIHQVEGNKIDRVNLSADRTQAQVPNPSGGQPFLVNLPNDPDLINILTKNGVFSPRLMIVSGYGLPVAFSYPFCYWLGYFCYYVALRVGQAPRR